MPIISRVTECESAIDIKRREKKVRYDERMRKTKWKEEMRMRRARQAILIPSTFRDTGDREPQDEMTLIHLITVIIRLRLAESKGVSRLGVPEKESRKRRKREKKNERGSVRSADITISC